jgi:F-type H+-transporting ATPase subunit alpha
MFNVLLSNFSFQKLNLESNASSYTDEEVRTLRELLDVELLDADRRFLLNCANFSSISFNKNNVLLLENKNTSSAFSGLETGLVISYKDGVVVATGLPSLRVNELVFFRNGATGVALNLETNVVKALVFNDIGSLRAGEFIYASGFLLRINVGKGLLGRVIDPLGVPLDGRGEIESHASYPIERKAPGVITRKKVSQPLHTGIRIIDSLVPIGRGQRELILGDRKTGKTSIVLDTFINQT